MWTKFKKIGGRSVIIAIVWLLIVIAFTYAVAWLETHFGTFVIIVIGIVVFVKVWDFLIDLKHALDNPWGKW